MILKYLDKQCEKPTKDKIKGLIAEFKLPEELATKWVEKLYPHHKDNMEKLNPRRADKKSTSY